MARQCFCGCGRRVGLLKGRISKLGERHDVLLSEVQALVIPQLEADAVASDTDFDYAATIDRVEAFISDGEQLRWRLAAIVHGDDTAEAGDREQIHAWQAMAAQLLQGPSPLAG